MVDFLSGGHLASNLTVSMWVPAMMTCVLVRARRRIVAGRGGNKTRALARPSLQRRRYPHARRALLIFPSVRQPAAGPRSHAHLLNVPHHRRGVPQSYHPANAAAATAVTHRKTGLSRYYSTAAVSRKPTRYNEVGSERGRSGGEYEERTGGKEHEVGREGLRRRSSPEKPRLDLVPNALPADPPRYVDRKPSGTERREPNT